jgi:hypothetical protein
MLVHFYAMYRVLVVKLEGKSLLGRPRQGWEDNSKMDLNEMGFKSEDWIQMD